jgi:hypothetical protein
VGGSLKLQGSSLVGAIEGPPDYPLLGTYAIGGQQNYQDSSVTAALAKRHVNILTHFPGWQNSRGMSMAQCMANIDAASTIDTQNFIYIIYSSINSNSGNSGQSYYEPYHYIDDNNLWAWTNGVTETGGPLTSQADANQLQTNYTLGGKTVSGKKLYQYYIDWAIGVHRDGASTATGPSTSAAAAVNPNVAGFFFDNVFYKERTNADYDRNGSLDGNTAGMSHIQNSHLAARNYYFAQWPSAKLLVNSADWPQLKYDDGGNLNTTPFIGLAHGGAIETMLSYQSTGATESSTSFIRMMDSIKIQIDAFADPKWGVMGCRINGFTDYAFMRYGLGISCLTGAYYYPYSTNYLSQDLPSLWYDEFNFNLGQPTTAVPTAAQYFSTGTFGEGVWRRDFENGIVLVGARRGGGVVTSFDQTTPYGSISLGGTFYRLRGTQAPGVNSGASVTNLTGLTPRDAIILSRTPT